VWHLGQHFGFSVRGIHVFPHRWHVSVGSLGMSWVPIIFSFSVIFLTLLYYHDNISAYIYYSRLVGRLYSLFFVWFVTLAGLG
jgi:hypothetical protein